MFLKVILYFYVFGFCSKYILVFFFKNWFKGYFARSSRLRASHEMCLREIKKSHFHTKSLVVASRVFHDKILLAKCFQVKTGNFSISHRGYHDCLATKSFSRKLQCVLQLPNLQKTHVFSFYAVDMTVFQALCFFPRTTSLKPPSTQNPFSLKPHHFQAKISAKLLQGMFS